MNRLGNSTTSSILRLLAKKLDEGESPDFIFITPDEDGVKTARHVSSTNMYMFISELELEKMDIINRLREEVL